MRTVRSSGRISGGVPVPGGVPGQVLPPLWTDRRLKDITFATSLRTVIRVKIAEFAEITDSLVRKHFSIANNPWVFMKTSNGFTL